MKVKARKASLRTSRKDIISDLSKKKGRDDKHAQKIAAAALIMSSPKKKHAGARHASKAKTKKSSASETDSAHGNHDLRLAFPSINGASAEHKGISTALDTIFSPVFHLFKGLNGETPSNNCRNSIEVVNPCEVKSEDTGVSLDEVEDCSVVYRASHKASEKVVLPEPVAVDAAPPSANDHINAVSNSTDEEVFGSQAAFDVGVSSMEWSLEVENRVPEHIAERTEDGVFDAEGSSLYLAVQQSKALGCSHETRQVEITTEEDDLDDFDPYLFIKHLPDLSEVVSSSRPPVLLPRQTEPCPPITLVLDLDETLVHSTLERCDDVDFTFPVHFNSQEYTVYVRCRPHLQTFMERVAQMFEIIVFTASQSIYADQLLNMLDPNRNLIRHRVFRDSCVFVEGNYLKDLTVLGRDLSKVAIVDNSPQAFGFQIDNGIPIESWFDDKSDCALMGLLPFLETLVGVDDVRPIIAKKFNLRQKIAAAMDHTSACLQPQ